MMSRRTAGRLPRSFIPKSAAMDLWPLFDDEIRARQLFLEISDRRGIKEATRIFDETATVAKKMTSRPKKPMGPHDPLKNLQLLTVWKVWTKQTGCSQKTKFAAWFIEWNGETMVSREAIVKRLDRALAAAKGL
jgi:hypothetical protein